MRYAKGIAGAAVGAISLATVYIAGFEGKENKPYLDAVGIPTYCHGITTNVDMGRIYTDAECYYLLDKEVSKVARAVDRLFTYPMADKTKASVISLTYNIGEGALAKSTLRRKMNAGDVRGACEEMRRWVYAGGRKLRGLVNRREAERKLCLEGLSDATVSH